MDKTDAVDVSQRGRSESKEGKTNLDNESENMASEEKNSSQSTELIC